MGRTHEGESTDAGHRGGPTRISVEVSVMGMERRGWIIWPNCLANQRWEEPEGKATPLSCMSGEDGTSRMTGDFTYGCVSRKGGCAQQESVLLWQKPGAI